LTGVVYGPDVLPAASVKALQAIQNTSSLTSGLASSFLHPQTGLLMEGVLLHLCRVSDASTYTLEKEAVTQKLKAVVILVLVGGGGTETMQVTPLRRTDF